MTRNELESLIAADTGGGLKVVSYGMSPAEVKAILGEPDFRRKGDVVAGGPSASHYEEWVYRLTSGINYIVGFCKGIVVSECYTGQALKRQ